jgi:dTDP-4-dehydrorhamnose reductase
MSQWFTTTQSTTLFHSSARRRPVLVTGAAGRIGSYFTQHSHRRYDLRLMVHQRSDGRELSRYGQVVEADLADLGRLKDVCAGIDTVLHLAATPDPEADWPAILQANIIGCYHLFAAAIAARCRRVIFASSIHAVSGYPADVQVKAGDPVNPGDLYGVSKCFGEALGRYVAEKEGVSVIALRIGAFEPREKAEQQKSLGMMDAFVSRRDLQQLIERCIDVENLQFAIFNGLSENRFNRLDMSSARELLGYESLDDFTQLHPQLTELNLPQRVKAHSVVDNRKSGMRRETGRHSGAGKDQPRAKTDPQEERDAGRSRKLRRK